MVVVAVVLVTCSEMVVVDPLLFAEVGLGVCV